MQQRLGHQHRKVVVVVKRCEWKLLRFMAGVRWEDHLINEKVERYGILK